jgi:hypothetical protein
VWVLVPGAGTGHRIFANMEEKEESHANEVGDGLVARGVVMLMLGHRFLDHSNRERKLWLGG